MLLRVFLACFALCVILGFSEILWRLKVVHGEYARKSIHIAAGTFIAFLPFWLDYGWIVILALAFIAVNALNHANHMLQSIFSVKRKSWGDLLFSFAILICALVAPDKWIFAAAILHVSLADGFAALVGSYLGHYHGVYYEILRHRKSAIGSAAFMVTSFAVVALAILMSPGFTVNGMTAAGLVLLPVGATLVESFGVYGIDNLTLPVLVLMSLTALAGA